MLGSRPASTPNRGRTPMTMVGSQKIVAEITDQIAAKQRLYRSAFSADLVSLRRRHGDGIVAEALQRLDQTTPAGAWDAHGHRREVERAVDRLLQRWQPQDHRLRE